MFLVTSSFIATLLTASLFCVLTITNAYASQEKGHFKQKKESVIASTNGIQSVDKGIRQTTSLDNQKALIAIDKAEAESLLSTKKITKLAKAESRLLAHNIEKQYQQLQHSIETEDAYSRKLGEDYYSYGLLLRDANQFDEAINAFVNSLHIEKINQGIYSLSQRAYLLALFETYFILNNNDEINNYLDRILWLEDQNSDKQGTVSFNLLMRVGHYYLDIVDRKPVKGERTMESLVTAKKYFLSAISHYGDRPISELFMPYTELALISYLEKKYNPDQFLLTSKNDSRPFNNNRLRNDFSLNRNQMRDPFVDGYKLLKVYLDKANTEENNFHVLKSLIALGDLHQLFDKKNKATELYKVALDVAKLTDQEDVLSEMFSKPVVLPNFHYAKDREVVTPTRPSILIPITFNVSKKGWVSDLVKFVPESEFAKYYSLARKEVNKLTFRPKISSVGIAVSTDVDHTVRVYVNK